MMNISHTSNSQLPSDKNSKQATEFMPSLTALNKER
jgi:hypothetical protein